MSDFFGENPQRPDVPEFWHLSEVVLQMDGRCEEPGGFDATVREVIPPEVLAYMSIQRAFRALGARTQEEVARIPPELLAVVGSLYVDGFIAGANYRERYPKDG